MESFVCFLFFPFAKSQQRYQESNLGMSEKITDLPSH
jgi:hypothetical protein